MKHLIKIVALIALAGCTDLKMQSSKDPNAHFENYETWCWLNGCTPTYEGPDYIYPEHMMEDMVNIMAEVMYDKGYIQGDDQSDLLLDFHIVVAEDSAKNAFVHEEALPLWENYDVNDAYYHFLKGTLIIDVADRQKGQIIFRSETQKYLSKYSKISHQEIEKGIRRAMKGFPSRTKKSE